MRVAIAAALLACSALAIVDRPLPVISALGDTNNWCKFVVSKVFDTNYRDTQPPAACAKVASIRCESWWGEDVSLLTMCKDLYVAALLDTSVHFPSGFFFVTKTLGDKPPGFAAAKAWFLDTKQTLTRKSVEGMLKNFGRDLLDRLLALSVDSESVHQLGHRSVFQNDNEREQWVVKMYKRVQVTSYAGDFESPHTYFSALTYSDGPRR